MRLPTISSRAVGAILLGFAAAFILITIGKYTPLNLFRSQLIAGDPVTNGEFPTTIGTFQEGMAIANDNSAMLYWISVAVLGTIFSIVAFKLLRRYV